MERAYRCLFWGYIIVIVNYILQLIIDFPGFIGWAVVCVGIYLLNHEHGQKYYWLAMLAAGCIVIENISLYLPVMPAEPIPVMLVFLNAILELLFIFALFQGLAKTYQQWQEFDRAKRSREFLVRYLIVQSIYLSGILFCFLRGNSDYLLAWIIYECIIRVFIVSRFCKNRWRFGQLSG